MSNLFKKLNPILLFSLLVDLQKEKTTTDFPFSGRAITYKPTSATKIRKRNPVRGLTKKQKKERARFKSARIARRKNRA